MRRALSSMLMPAAVLLFFIALPAYAAAQGEPIEVSTADLLDNWEELDGREVIFRGEAIGDVMVRGEYAWITVNDDYYSEEALVEAGELRGGNSGMAVWLPASEAETIGSLGRFGAKGDFVEVRGVFNATCLEHGGDFDIHARSLQVIDEGRSVDTSPDGGIYIGALFACIFAAGTIAPYLWRRMRGKEDEGVRRVKRK